MINPNSFSTWPSWEKGDSNRNRHSAVVHPFEVNLVPFPINPMYFRRT